MRQARLGYLRSDQLRSTPWAARGLALLAGTRGDHVSAAELYARAVAQAPTCLPLLVEATDQLLAAGRPAACLAMIDAAPERSLRTAEWSCSGHAPCWPTGKPTRPVPSSKPGSRCPIFGRGRRWAGCGGRRSATGHCRTTTTSGCGPTSTGDGSDKLEAWASI